MIPSPASIDPRDVTLRAVIPEDLPTLFEQQRDPEAVRMAAFPCREHDDFMAHWAKILADRANIALTILNQNRIAGRIGSWTGGDQRLVGYVLGRDFWGRGIATAALKQFLPLEPIRPLTALVVQHNLGSLRVLQKNGFVITGEDTFTAPDGNPAKEFVLTLAAS